MITRIAPILFVYSLIVGCGSTPYSKEIWMEPEKVSIQDDQEKQKIGYLARYLMPKEEALKLDKNIQSSQWLSDDLMRTSAGFAGSLLQTGNPFSTPGVNAFGNLNTALTVASWLLPDGGIMENVSGIYLPKTWNGKTISTQEEAKEIGITHTEQQLQKTAVSLNLKYSCIANCDSTMSRVYHLAYTPETDFSHLVYQAPEGVYVATHWLDLVQSKQTNPVENAAVGFDIGWQSPAGNTWVIGFYGAPILDENGKVGIREGENGYVYPLVQDLLNYTELGRMLYREYSNDGGYLFMGSDDQVPNMVAFDGKLYSFSSRRADRFIDNLLVD